MSTIAASSDLTTPTPDAASVPQRSAFRVRNPLRAGFGAFCATLAVAGGVLALLNVGLNRGIDTYYDRQIAELAAAPTDATFTHAAALAASEADDAPAVDATVSAN